MLRRFLLVLLAVILIHSISNPVGATTILDQNAPHNQGGFGTGAALNQQQEVVVGVGGLLSSIDLWSQVSGSIDFYINLGSAWQSDTNDFSQTGLVMSVTQGWINIDVSSANLLLDIGDTFVIGVQGTDSGAQIGGNNNYASGQLHRVLTVPGYDPVILPPPSFGGFAFRTYMDTDSAPVPEPATMLLFGLGLLGLAGVSRKKK